MAGLYRRKNTQIAAKTKKEKKKLNNRDEEIRCFSNNKPARPSGPIYSANLPKLIQQAIKIYKMERKNEKILKKVHVSSLGSIQSPLDIRN